MCLYKKTTTGWHIPTGLQNVDILFNNKLCYKLMTCAYLLDIIHPMIVCWLNIDRCIISFEVVDPTSSLRQSTSHVTLQPLQNKLMRVYKYKPVSQLKADSSRIYRCIVFEVQSKWIPWTWNHLCTCMAAWTDHGPVLLHHDAVRWAHQTHHWIHSGTLLWTSSSSFLQASPSEHWP